MKILFLCHRIPYPPNKGEKIRAFHQLKAMAAHHQVDLFTLADRKSDLEHRAALLEYCEDVVVPYINPRIARVRSLPWLATRKPLTLPYFYSPALDHAVRRALEERTYDRIFVSCSAMAQYVPQGSAIPVVIDLVDVDSDKWTQYASFSKPPFSLVYAREGRCLQRFEKKICDGATCVVVSTGREAQLVRGFSGAANVHVVPNGVDAEFFSQSAYPPNQLGPAIVFTGDMSYFPNEEAVIFFSRKVLPLIQQSVPSARFLIVGREPTPNVRRLEQLPGVEVTGFVADVRAYLAQAQVSVAPFSIAAGIQNKILEAMAYGLPVVATPRAVQGLSKAVAALVETGSTPQELSTSILRLLANPVVACERGAQGRRRVMEDYSWTRALTDLLEAVTFPTARSRSPVASL